MPQWCKPWILNPEQQKLLQTQVDDFIEEGVVEQIEHVSEDAWISAQVPVLKARENKPLVI